MRDERKTKARLIAELRELRGELAALRTAPGQPPVEQIIQHVADGIMVQDRSGRLIYVNAAAAQASGFPSAEALLATPLAEVLAKFQMFDEAGAPFPADRLPGRLALQGVAEPPTVTMRVRLVETGEEHWSQITATPLLDAAGSIAMAINIWHDVTAFKRIERQLAEQREYLAVTLASIGDAVVVADLAGRITFLNPVAAALLRTDAALAHGQPLAALFSIASETGAPLENPVARVLREGTPAGLANRTLLIRPDGSAVPIDDSSAPIRDAAGAIIGVVLVFRDISQRRAAEAALRESEARFRLLADSAPVLVWMSGPDGGCTYFNRPWLEWTGRPLERQLGAGWTESVHADDLRRCLDTYHTHFDARQPFVMEYRLRRADGDHRWVLDSGIPLRDAGGAFAGFIGSCTEIHEQKVQSERQRFLAELGEALAASLDVGATLDTLARLVVPQVADWCVIDMLEEDGRLLRLAVAHPDPAQAERARALHERYPPRPDTPGGIHAAIRGGKALLHGPLTDELLAAGAGDAEHLAVLRELNVRSAIIAPLITRGRAQGAITFVSAESGRAFGPDDLTLAEEIVRRAALALDNAQLYRAAQDALEKRDQFLSIATHELKTPITSLLGYAQLLQRRARREGGVSERNQHAVDVIAEQAMRLNRLILGVLDISRLQLGQLAIERVPLDLAALVRRVADSMPPSASHPLRLRLPERAPILGDELRLEQVLHNLIQNAVRYSPGGGPVAIELEAAGGWARCSVTDRGVGIPAEELPKLFERFYRASRAATLHITGMGVGLYVVREIVRLHGGTVEVSSAEGRGSTFSIILPALGDGDIDP